MGTVIKESESCQHTCIDYLGAVVEVRLLGAFIFKGKTGVLLSFLPAVFISMSVFATESTHSAAVNDGILKLSETTMKEHYSSIEFDTTRIYTTPYGGKYYIEAVKANEAFQSDPFLPVNMIPIEQFFSSSQLTAMTSHPAVADKIGQEAALASYDSFTTGMRNLLRGRIPPDTIAGTTGNLFGRTSKYSWLASNDEVGVDYLGQEEDEDNSSYATRLAEGAKAIVNGPWFTLVEVYGHYFDQDPMGNLSGFKSSGYGLQGALLRPTGDSWLLGLYGARQSLSADIRYSDGEVETGTWRMGPTFAFGSGAVHAEGLLTYNWNTTDNKINGYKSNYKSGQWDVFLGGGYDFDLEKSVRGLMFTPELEVMYSSQERDGYHWLYNNYIDKGNSSGWTTRLGGSLSYDRLQFEQPLALKVAVGWQYNQYKTDDLKSSNGLHSDYEHYDQHAMYYSAGIDTFLNERLNLSLSYAGSWSRNALGHYLQAGMEFRF